METGNGANFITGSLFAFYAFFRGDGNVSFLSHVKARNPDANEPRRQGGWPQRNARNAKMNNANGNWKRSEFHHRLPLCVLCVLSRRWKCFLFVPCQSTEPGCKRTAPTGRMAAKERKERKDEQREWKLETERISSPAPSLRSMRSFAAMEMFPFCPMSKHGTRMQTNRADGEDGRKGTQGTQR